MTEGGSGISSRHRHGADLLHQADGVKHGDVFGDLAVFDAVIDFDLATRDPSNPARLLPAYDSGDHLHPNDAGYRAMADAVVLSLFHADND